MNQPWDTKGCYQRIGPKRFETCAKCNHKFIDWLRLEEIECKNKCLKQQFDVDLADYDNKKKQRVKGLKKPTVQ